VATVAGVDGCRRGWVAVVLHDGRFAGAATYTDFAGVLRAALDGGSTVIGVDMPIGLLEQGTRVCETEARARLGPMAGTIFPMPPRAVLDAPTHAEALRRCRELGVPGVSAQGFALRAKIAEVEAAAAAARAAGTTVLEVHPELAFLAMAGGDGPLARKRTWDGLWRREELLREQGVTLPRSLPDTRGAAPDDVLDAAAVAWTADRYARGAAVSLPATPQRGPDGSEIAIWY
jgi:predicted RNase H-like nuclease